LEEGRNETVLGEGKTLRTRPKRSKKSGRALGARKGEEDPATPRTASRKNLHVKKKRRRRSSGLRDINLSEDSSESERINTVGLEGALRLRCSKKYLKSAGRSH